MPSLRQKAIIFCEMWWSLSLFANNKNGNKENRLIINTLQKQTQSQGFRRRRICGKIPRWA